MQGFPALVDHLGLSERVHVREGISDDDLPFVYNGALALVYPSYFEGFGLPPLEAMQCGVPVIVGDRTSLPEVVGAAGVLVDPFDVNALAAAIEKVISDSNLRAKLSVQGLARAKLFEWRGTARQTLAVYQKAVSN